MLQEMTQATGGREGTNYEMCCARILESRGLAVHIP